MMSDDARRLLESRSTAVHLLFKKKILFFSSFSISLVNLGAVAGFFAEKKRDDDSVDSILMKSDNLLSGALHSIVIQKRRGECTYIESEPTK